MSVLVAGFGNIFLSDDGFGSAVIRELAGADRAPHVRLRDFGTGGMHLAMEMLGGHDLVIIVDAVARPEPPGTLFAIDCTNEYGFDETAPDAHAMTIGAVLAVYARMRDELSAPGTAEIIVVGCVPQDLGEGMELSEPVRAAIPACIELIHRLAQAGAVTGAQP